MNPDFINLLYKKIENCFINKNINNLNYNLYVENNEINIYVSFDFYFNGLLYNFYIDCGNTIDYLLSLKSMDVKTVRLNLKNQEFKFGDNLENKFDFIVFRSRKKYNINMSKPIMFLLQYKVFNMNNIDIEKTAVEIQKGVVSYNNRGQIIPTNEKNKTQYYMYRKLCAFNNIHDNHIVLIFLSKLMYRYWKLLSHTLYKYFRKGI